MFNFFDKHCPFINQTYPSRTSYRVVNFAMNAQDLATMLVGAAAWTLAIIPVKMAGSACANENGTAEKSKAAFNKSVCMVIGVAIAAVTTPAIAGLCGWRSAHERVRGIAIALGTAQTIDGMMHIWNPTFYSKNRDVAVACAGNIFLGAGLLGILSAYM
jgi:type IV secretory pathway VirB2 component (pilin)